MGEGLGPSKAMVGHGGLFGIAGIGADGLADFFFRAGDVEDVIDDLEGDAQGDAGLMEEGFLGGGSVGDDGPAF